MDDRYMTVKEASALWGISERRIRALFNDGKLAGARKSGESRTSPIIIPADLPKPPDGRRMRTKCAFPELSAFYADCDAKRAKLDALGPLGGNAKAALDAYDGDFMLRLVYNSNAIEGSTLTLRDTELVLEGEFVAEQDARWQFAARGVYEGTLYARKLLAHGVRLSRDVVQDVHEHTALDLQPGSRGVFRRYPVYIRGSRTVPLDWVSIYGALDQLVYETSRFSGHGIERAALFHCRFEHIHPFGDGNGRTGRVLLNAMLEKAGYPPVALKAKGARDYFAALERAQADGEPQDFIRMLAQNVSDELDGRLHAVESAGSDEADAPRSFLLYLVEPAGDGRKRLTPAGAYGSLLDAIEAAAEMPTAEGQWHAVYGGHQDILDDEPLWTDATPAVRTTM